MFLAKPFSAYAQSLALAVVWGLVPLAHALDKPEGKVVLTATGRIAHTNAGTEAHFDMKMLEALPQNTLTTQTPWYPQPVTFRGPLLRDVLAALGARNVKSIDARAINDYKITIPAEDAAKLDVTLAISLDGKPMAVRDKGPIFVIYPMNHVTGAKLEQYAQRSIWQLKSLKVD